MSGWYGSLQNRLMERSAGPVPEVGMGVSECSWSDRNAYEVIEVIDDRHILVRRMKAVLKKGSDWFDQDYDLFSDENGSVIKLFKKKNGCWAERIGKNGVGCNGFSIGVAREYRDPSF